MSKRTPPFENYPEWTSSKFWSFIRAGLRQKFNRWPPKWQVLKDNSRPVTGKRHKTEYQCNACKKWFKKSDVEVDHIVAVGSLKSAADLPAFVMRLFVGTEGLQVLCKPCHREKT